MIGWPAGTRCSGFTPVRSSAAQKGVIMQPTDSDWMFDEVPRFEATSAYANPMVRSANDESNGFTIHEYGLVSGAIGYSSS